MFHPFFGPDDSMSRRMISDSFLNPTGDWGTGAVAMRHPTVPFAEQDKYRTIVPRLDIIETDVCLCVWADLCGVKKEDIDITVVDDQLTIQAKKAPEHDASLDRTLPHATFIAHERNKGQFHRIIRLPASCERDASEACYTDGVLHLKFNKKGAGTHGAPKKLFIKA